MGDVEKKWNETRKTVEETGKQFGNVVSVGARGVASVLGNTNLGGKTPVKRGDFIGQLLTSSLRGAEDVAKGTGKVLQGDITGGVSQVVTGALAASTGGLTERAGLTTSSTQEMQAEASAAEAQRLETEQLTARENARIAAINKRLETEIALRNTVPGRSATLLGGSSLFPAGRNTLLTIGKK
ncbi:MAG TPA: hypothetical protein VIH27_02820 [Nitrososphaerales archaeon]